MDIWSPLNFFCGRQVKHFLHLGQVNAGQIIRNHQYMIFNFQLLEFSRFRVQPKVILYQDIKYHGELLLMVHTLLFVHHDIIRVNFCVLFYPSKQYGMDEVLDVSGVSCGCERH